MMKFIITILCTLVFLLLDYFVLKEFYSRTELLDNTIVGDAIKELVNKKHNIVMTNPPAQLAYGIISIILYFSIMVLIFFLGFVCFLFTMFIL